MRKPAALLVLLALAACGGAQTLRTDAVEQRLGLGGQDRRVTLLTDVDRVRDLAASDSRIFAATDLGVLAYPASGDAQPTRITKAEGLPANDTLAVAVHGTDVFVATSGGMALIQGDRAQPVGAEPPVGKVADLAFRENGALFACGERGLARFQNGAWERFGEELRCTVLENGPEGTLWVGSAQGLYVIEAEDTIREHAVSRGIPEAYVQDIAPLSEGRALALLRGPSSSVLGYWDGERWYGYTIDGFAPKVLGLVAQGSKAILFTRGHAFVIGRREGGSNVRLSPISAATSSGALSYRARITPAANVTASSTQVPELRDAATLAPLSPSAPSVEAPALDVRPMDGEWPRDLYQATTFGGSILVADHNRGILHRAPSGDRLLRTNDLIAEQLSTATDTNGRTWLVTTKGDLVTLDDEGVLKRMPLPENVFALAVAMGEGGAHLLARVGQTGAVLRVYRADAGRWSQVTERTLTLPSDLAGVPFFGIDSSRKFWVAVEVRAGAQKRARGVAVFDASSETITYHHRGATPATDGPGATPLIDEVEAVAFENQFAWFASLSGAVRVGDSQAVAYGEARGVRGELVSDLVAAPGGKIWVAAAEGVGAYENGAFNFILPATVQQMHPTSLAIDVAGNLYGAGPRGIVYYDGTAWQTITAASGVLPTSDLRDIDLDTRDRIWLLTDLGVLLMTR